jgi:hypothetical protein
MKSGNLEIASASATLSVPSARVVALRFPISAARSSRRSATALTRRALSVMNPSRTGVSSLSSRNRRLVVESAGFR